MADEMVKLELTPSEALVLFEFLARIDEGVPELARNPAEQKILWELEASLEKQVPVLSPNYRQLLDLAREEVESS